jgi:DNA-binding transcriptional LysR family regulator
MTIQQLQQAVVVADCGSINEAARQLFVSQPSLSHGIRELETELGISLFFRSNRGISITADGEEFLSYARQILEQYRLMEDRFGNAKTRKIKFSVSMQHYTFAVQAFIRVAKAHGIEQYAFAVHETKTAQVIQHVATLKSEVGVLYLDQSNRDILQKLFRESDIEFFPLFDCSISVYLAKSHPLAGEKRLTLQQLAPYPCLSFDQGANNSFHFAEKVLSTADYEKIIKRLFD